MASAITAAKEKKETTNQKVVPYERSGLTIKKMSRISRSLPEEDNQQEIALTKTLNLQQIEHFERTQTLAEEIITEPENYNGSTEVNGSKVKQIDKAKLSDDTGEDNPFDPSKNGLLVTRGFVNQVPALILIDPGAEINHLSEDLCRRAKIRTNKVPYKAQMADKSTTEIRVTRKKARVSIGGYSESFSLAACPLNYDVILGKKWCSTHKARIDCESNEVRFMYKYKRFAIKAIDRSESEISINSIDLRNAEYPIYAISIKTTR